MSDIHIPHKKEEDPVLTNALRAMFAMVVLVLIAVTAFQFSGMQKSAIPPNAEIIAEAQISISTDQTGAVQVFNAHGEILADWGGDKGGFVSGVARVIERERMKIGAPIDAPVIIRWRENNRLSVFDPQTEWQADLMGFGADNARAFATLLAKATKGN
jgi:putative photosynthetic complex assembly protein